MREYGCVRYELDFDRGEYVVTDEAGEELSAWRWETDAQRFCEEYAGKNA